MAKLLATIKAVITRVIFGTHGFIAIWQVTQYKKDLIYWYLCAPIGLLFFEGVFTLAIKKNQEWRWFCPSVFLYLGSVVPAIWLLELDKVERRMRIQEETINLSHSVGADLKDLDKLLGVQFKLPDIKVDAETWVTLIEQFLMLVLIIGRWMLPKGDLTRDQLSQLLLVYIGTAADIIEFFDSFKDSTIANEPLLVLLTLGIWSWSLLQFTIVLSATRSRKPRGGGSDNFEPETSNCCNNCCCSIDVWGIALNIVLQDAPFLAFRLLIIIHYRIISYMNVFFTCKNTLVIMLQLYRLYVVHSENRKVNKGKSKGHHHGKLQRINEIDELNEIYVISNDKHNRKKKRKKPRPHHDYDDGDESDDEYERHRRPANKKSQRHISSGKKDTGYSTASSQSSSPPCSPKRESRPKRQNNTKKVGDKIRSKSENNTPNLSSKRSSSDHRDRCDEQQKRKYKRDSESSRSRQSPRTTSHDNVSSRDKKRKSRKENKILEVTENSNSSNKSSEIEKRARKDKKKKHRRIATTSDSETCSD